MTLGAKLFSFEGRLRRADWWVLGILLDVLMSLTGFLADQVLPETFIPTWNAKFGDPLPVLLASAAISLAFLWPMVAITAKRAQDVNWPAWPFVMLCACFMVVGYLPNSAPIFAWPPAVGTLATWVSILAALAVFVPLAFIDGTPGPNRFGPSPKVLPPESMEPETAV